MSITFAKSSSVETKPLRLLIVGDDPRDAQVYLRNLDTSGIAFQADTTLTHEDFVRELRERPPDVVLANYLMSGWTGMDVLAWISDICPGVPLIIVSETPGDDLAAECIKRGASDYVRKDQLSRLPIAVIRAQKESFLRIAERRACETRYRSLVENVACGVCGISLDGTILHANSSLARMLGYDSPEEVLAAGNAALFFRHSCVRDEVFAQYRQDDRADSTVEWQRKDGKTITVRTVGWRTRHPQRGNEYIQVIVENVTERFTLEKQLIQAQKFEPIGQLAGGIAHDFGNMIGAIIGWADLGVEEAPPGSRLQRHFEKVRHQADRAAALTRQLLAFARRQVLEPVDIDLNQAVIETLSLLEKVIGSNIRITANLSPHLAIVRADPVQVEQVLMNLCINARDAMPQGGSLTVQTTNVAFGEESCARQPLMRPGEYAMLSVTDTGTGMEAAVLDRIFEPFFTTKEIGKGTGLGLASVYGIVRQHGGFVQVDSEPGKGTTFRIYFPASAGAGVRPSPAGDIRAVLGGSETLLIAEDHDGMRQIDQETLTNLGYHVLVASDGEQAVKKFLAHSHGVDLVLLDMALPKLSGLEVYAHICRDKPEVLVIFATAGNSGVDLPHPAPSEGLAVLRKPYAPRDLALKVRQVLDHHARLSRKV